MRMKLISIFERDCHSMNFKGKDFSGEDLQFKMLIGLKIVNQISDSIGMLFIYVLNSLPQRASECKSSFLHLYLTPS